MTTTSTHGSRITSTAPAPTTPSRPQSDLSANTDTTGSQHRAHTAQTVIGPERKLRRLRRWAAALLVSVGLLSGTSLLAASSADAAVYLGGVWAVSTASYDCGAHTITVWPMTNEPLDGGFSVYSSAQVRDRASGTWISTGWLLDTGIQGHVFYNMRNFDPYAKVTYARFINNAWVYQSEWIPIQTNLDSMGVFCNP